MVAWSRPRVQGRGLEQVFVALSKKPRPQPARRMRQQVRMLVRRGGLFVEDAVPASEVLLEMYAVAKAILAELRARGITVRYADQHLYRAGSKGFSVDLRGALRGTVGELWVEVKWTHGSLADALEEARAVVAGRFRPAALDIEAGGSWFWDIARHPEPLPASEPPGALGALAIGPAGWVLHLETPDGPQLLESSFEPRLAVAVEPAWLQGPLAPESATERLSSAWRSCVAVVRGGHTEVSRRAALGATAPLPSVLRSEPPSPAPCEPPARRWPQAPRPVYRHHARAPTPKPVAKGPRASTPRPAGRTPRPAALTPRTWRQQPAVRAPGLFARLASLLATGKSCMGHGLWAIEGPPGPPTEPALELAPERPSKRKYQRHLRKKDKHTVHNLRRSAEAKAKAKAARKTKKGRELAAGWARTFVTKYGREEVKLRNSVAAVKYRAKIKAAKHAAANQAQQGTGGDKTPA